MRTRPERVTGALGAGSATRNVDNLRNKDKITDMLAKGSAQLADLSGNHQVTLDWELNEMAVRDKIFKLTVDDKEVYIDLEELMFVQRVMFQKK